MIQCSGKGGPLKMLNTILVVSIIIVIIVLLLAVITTSKAYTFKHTVDPLENNPFVDQELTEQDKDQKKA
jgi:uncharacterized protein YpmB